MASCNAPPGVYNGYGFNYLLQKGWCPGKGLGKNGEGMRHYPRAKMQSIRFKQNKWHGVGCACKLCQPFEPDLVSYDLEYRCKMACPNKPQTEASCFSQLENLYHCCTLKDEERDEDLIAVFDVYLIPRLQFLFKHWNLASAPRKYLFLLQGWLALGSHGLQRYVVNRTVVPKIARFLLKSFDANEFEYILREWSPVLPDNVQQIIFHSITGKLISHLEDWARNYHETRFDKITKPHPCTYLATWSRILSPQQRSKILLAVKDIFPLWKSKGYLSLQFLFGWLSLISVDTIVKYVDDSQFFCQRFHSYHSLFGEHLSDELINLGLFSWGVFSAIPIPRASALLSKIFDTNFAKIQDQDIQSAWCAIGGSIINHERIKLTKKQKVDMWRELLYFLADCLNLQCYSQQTKSGGLHLRFAGKKLHCCGRLNCFIDFSGVHFVSEKKLVFEDESYEIVIRQNLGRV